jgi:Cotton fibre expressed protein
MPRSKPRYNLPAKSLWRILTSLISSNLSRIKHSKSLKSLKNVLGRRRSKFIYARRSVHRHIYVDELYMQPVTSASVVLGDMTSHEMKKVNMIKKNDKKDYCHTGCSTSELSSKGAAWEMEEVDIRAEMFINKFKEEMRLQRQRSLKEYQEMLARGV